MSRSIRRSVFLLFSIVLWSVVLFVALNVYEAVRWRAVVKSNGFVAAQTTGAPWPMVRENANESGDTFSYPENVKLQEPVVEEKPADQKTQLDQNVRRFLALSEDERKFFDAGLFELIVIIGSDGKIHAVYSPREEVTNQDHVDQFLGQSAATLAPLDKGPEAVDTALRVLRTGQSELRSFNGSGDDNRDVFFFPVNDATGRATAVGATLTYQYVALSGTLWDVQGFRFKKHARSPESGRRTNNFGFRGRDVAIPKPAGRFRIVCVGGSTTEEGPADDITYPALLEKKLNVVFNGHPVVEVVNCGIPIIDSAGERAHTLDYLELQPDLILYYHGTNDLTLKRAREWVNAEGWVTRTARRSPFLNRVMNLWLLPTERVMRESIEASWAKNIGIMLAYAKTHGAEMAVASFACPDSAMLTREERDFYDYSTRRASVDTRNMTFTAYSRALSVFNDVVRDFCATHQLLYIPVAENLHGGSEYFWDICHMSLRGMNAKADIMLPYVRDLIQKRQ